MMRVKAIGILLLLTFFLLFPLPAAMAATKGATTGKPATAANGVLDLRNVALASNGPVALDGTWSFYWDRLLTPGQLRRAGVAPAPIAVPRPWNGQSVSGRGLPGQGYGTYALKVLLPRSAVGKVMALYMPDIASSYRLWINGQLMGQIGRVGVSRQSMTPRNVAQVIAFQSGRQQVDLCLQVSNFYERKGGLWSPITLGYQPQIQAMREWNLVSTFLVVGSLLILGIYQMVIFILNRSEKVSLFFSLTSILIALRALVVGDEFLNMLFPSLPWGISTKMVYLTATLGTLYYARYTFSMFPKESNRYVEYAARAFMTGFSAFVLATPAIVYTNWMLLLQILIVPIFLVLTYISVLAALRRRPGAALNLAGNLILSATVVSDNLYYANLIPTGPLIMWGYMGCLFMQSILLARRFVAAHRASDRLSHELAGINETLEAKIAERTKQLSVALAELSEIERDRRQLIDDIAHEIGTPLSKIQGYVKAILDGVIKDHYPKYLKIVYDKSEFIGRMLQDLYQLTSLQSRRLAFEFQMVDLAEWMKGIYEKYLPDMKSHPFRMGVRGQSDLPDRCSAYVRVDPIRLEQVIANLLSNAAKYSPIGSEIALGLELHPSTAGQAAIASISVADQGAGIPEVEQERIFHRFYRMKNLQGDAPGAGLGLAICREIVRHLDGELALQSGPHGSVFTILLPMMVLPDETEAKNVEGQGRTDEDGG